jgi:hypothetical protein
LRAATKSRAPAGGARHLEPNLNSRWLETPVESSPPSLAQFH